MDRDSAPAWGHAVAERLKALEIQQQHLHDCLEETHKETLGALNGLGLRLAAVENLRGMVIGGGAVLLALSPFWGYLLWRLMPALSKIAPP